MLIHSSTYGKLSIYYEYSIAINKSYYGRKSYITVELWKIWKLFDFIRTCHQLTVNELLLSWSIVIIINLSFVTGETKY